MKRNTRGKKRAKKPPLTLSMHCLMEHRNAIELALCHVAELIDLAQDIACNMSSDSTQPESILQISGRLTTLMHCAKHELDKAQHAAALL